MSTPGCPAWCTAHTGPYDGWEGDRDGSRSRIHETAVGDAFDVTLTELVEVDGTVTWGGMDESGEPFVEPRWSWVSTPKGIRETAEKLRQCADLIEGKVPAAVLAEVRAEMARQNLTQGALAERVGRRSPRPAGALRAGLNCRCPTSSPSATSCTSPPPNSLPALSKWQPAPDLVCEAYSKQRPRPCPERGRWCGSVALDVALTDAACVGRLARGEVNLHESATHLLEDVLGGHVLGCGLDCDHGCNLIDEPRQLNALQHHVLVGVDAHRVPEPDAQLRQLPDVLRNADGGQFDTGAGLGADHDCGSCHATKLFRLT